MTGANPVAAEEPARPTNVGAPMFVAKIEPAICNMMRQVETVVIRHNQQQHNYRVWKDDGSFNTEQDSDVSCSFVEKCSFSHVPKARGRKSLRVCYARRLLAPALRF